MAAEFFEGGSDDNQPETGWTERHIRKLLDDHFCRRPLWCPACRGKVRTQDVPGGDELRVSVHLRCAECESEYTYQPESTEADDPPWTGAEAGQMLMAFRKRAPIHCPTDGAWLRTGKGESGRSGYLWFGCPRCGRTLRHDL